jgi:hypothetical protein
VSIPKNLHSTWIQTEGTGSLKVRIQLGKPIKLLQWTMRWEECGSPVKCYILSPTLRINGLVLSDWNSLDYSHWLAVDVKSSSVPLPLLQILQQQCRCPVLVGQNATLQRIAVTYAPVSLNITSVYPKGIILMDPRLRLYAGLLSEVCDKLIDNHSLSWIKMCEI